MNQMTFNPSLAIEHADLSKRTSTVLVSVLFFCSGLPALIYQIVWERALFAFYGLNIQSVEIIVSIFMLGLGLGSRLGGVLSKNQRLSLVRLYAILEFATAIFGFFSMDLFRAAARLTAGGTLLETGLTSFALLAAPTVLMGATLPLLVEYSVRASHNVGTSIGSLYFANTLGSGFACFAAGSTLLRLLGQSGSVRIAALVNIAAALSALIYSLRSDRSSAILSQPQQSRERVDGQSPNTSMAFPLALVCSAFVGFIALSYEIIWYRLVAFATGDTAFVFAFLLGSYLFGLAFGSRWVARYSHVHRSHDAGRSAAILILVSAVLAFSVAPAMAITLRFVSPYASTGKGFAYLLMFLLILMGATSFGACFPMVTYASVRQEWHTGVALSYLYTANIIGSSLGALVVGFILMDHLTLFKISIALLLIGGSLSLAVFSSISRNATLSLARFGSGAVAIVIIVVVSYPVFSTIYDRVLFKNRFPAKHFQEVIDNRSGTIGVTPDGTVFGGGVYDGRFNIDLLHDTNMIVRPFALSALHAAPRRILMVGLGSGSWAQVIANHPQLDTLTIVEINPGYIELVSHHAQVANLLHNPKVHIVIDDGRRWMICNKQQFDVIVMNTTFHWRNHLTNLLSVEFLQIVRQHLVPGGVLFYNTTGSEDVIATALSVYPYALYIVNMLAVSDSPLDFNRERWKSVLLSYVIDGKRVIEPGDPNQLKELSRLMNIPEGKSTGDSLSFENNFDLRKRIYNGLIITDDNMGLEWR